MALSVTPTATYIGWNDNIKTVVKVLGTSPTTGATYDTNMDTGTTAEFREIFECRFSQSGGEDASYSTPPTWSNSTGIVTLGTVSPITATGYLTIVGK